MKMMQKTSKAIDEMNRKMIKEENEQNKKPKHITSLPWYNILCNPAYVRDFNYIPVANHSRDILIDEKINPE